MALSFSSSVVRRYRPSFPTRRSSDLLGQRLHLRRQRAGAVEQLAHQFLVVDELPAARRPLPGRRRRSDAVRQQRETDERDRKSTRLNSSHVETSYAVFCLKQKINTSA